MMNEALVSTATQQIPQTPKTRKRARLCRLSAGFFHRAAI